MDSMPDGAVDRLESLLIRTSKGNPTDYQTPLCRESGRAEAHEDFEKEVGYTEYSELTDIDTKERDNYGPLSPQLPSDERIPGLLRY
jgi:hypothetical protein